MANSTQEISATTAQADTGKRGMWWGYPLEFWQSVILWTMWGGFVATAFGAALAVISSFLAYQVSDVTQAEADRRIAVAGASADAANEASAKANAEAAKANKAAAEAHERTALLEKEAEQERLERLKLEARYAPRRLRREQAIPMIERLTPFAGKTVRLVSYVSDVEGVVLASGLAEVFQRAGLKIDEGRMSVQSFGSIAFGVFVDGRDQHLRNTLLAALVGSPVKAHMGNPMPHNLASPTADAIVFVAAKPLDGEP